MSELAGIVDGKPAKELGRGGIEAANAAASHKTKRFRQGAIRKTSGLACRIPGIGFAENMAVDDGPSVHQIATLEGGVALVSTSSFWLEG